MTLPALLSPQSLLALTRPRNRARPSPLPLPPPRPRPPACSSSVTLYQAAPDRDRDSAIVSPSSLSSSDVCTVDLPSVTSSVLPQTSPIPATGGLILGADDWPTFVFGLPANGVQDFIRSDSTNLCVHCASAVASSYSDPNQEGSKIHEDGPKTSRLQRIRASSKSSGQSYDSLSNLETYDLQSCRLDDMEGEGPPVSAGTSFFDPFFDESDELDDAFHNLIITEGRNTSSSSLAARSYSIDTTQRRTRGASLYPQGERLLHGSAASSSSLNTLSSATSASASASVSGSLSASSWRTDPPFSLSSTSTLSRNAPPSQLSRTHSSHASDDAHPSSAFERYCRARRDLEATHGPIANPNAGRHDDDLDSGLTFLSEQALGSESSRSLRACKSSLALSSSFSTFQPAEAYFGTQVSPLSPTASRAAPAHREYIFGHDYETAVRRRTSDAEKDAFVNTRYPSLVRHRSDTYPLASPHAERFGQRPDFLTRPDPSQPDSLATSGGFGEISPFVGDHPVPSYMDSRYSSPSPQHLEMPGKSRGASTLGPRFSRFATPSHGDFQQYRSTAPLLPGPRSASLYPTLGRTPSSLGGTTSPLPQLGPSPNNRKGELYKTELCRSWTETGQCRYQARCQFAHGLADLRPINKSQLGQYKHGRI